MQTTVLDFHAEHVDATLAGVEQILAIRQATADRAITDDRGQGVEPRRRSAAAAGDPVAVPRVLVVDPCFERYGDLARATRQGVLELHFRPTAVAALSLVQRRRFDLCIVAADLPDMAPADLLELLPRDDADSNRAKVAPASRSGAAPRAARSVSPGRELPRSESSGSAQTSGSRRDGDGAGLPSSTERFCESLLISMAAAATTVGLLVMR